MPIPVKDHVWHETLSSVYITLPLNNCNRNKVDIFYTPQYMKVSYPPYFFEIFLPHKIWSALTLNDLNEDAIDSLCDDNGVKCLINDNKIFLELLKLEQGVAWNNLCLELTKKDSKARRVAAVEWRHKYEELLARKRLREERARDRQAVSDSIDQDEIYRNQLQAKKEKIKSDFFKLDSDINTKNKRGVAFKEADIIDQGSTHDSSCTAKNLSPEDKSITNKSLDIIKRSNYNIALASRVALEGERLRDLPPPRNTQPFISVDASTQPENHTSVIITTFTPKSTKAPLREGRDEATENEMEWKKKEYQQKHNITSGNENKKEDKSDVDDNPIELDCQHLLEKGEQFFRVEDFSSAIEVYTHGINNANAMYAPFHNNRGAVHLRVGNLHGAITDCSKALELLVPKCKSNELQRVKAHVRIGTGEYKMMNSIYIIIRI